MQTRNMDQKLLTPAELKVMHLLWQKKKAFVKELIADWPEEGEKQPAYNTISTIIRILQKKGYVGHEAVGRSHRYFPLVPKAGYQNRLMQNVLQNVFSGSLSGMVSSLLDNQDLSDKQMDELKTLIDKSADE
ncbi:MAG: BlaI/MecI/CopY family transcriptional regulator [Bacteroidota bacterium]